MEALLFRRNILSAVLLAGLLMGQSVPRALAATYCDHAEFVSDITAPDGANFAPGTSFIKTWRFMNIGTCSWSMSYSVVFTGGDQLAAPLSVALPANVSPGQMVDIAVPMTAPNGNGHYKGLWKFKNPSNAQFGIGSSASNAFWIDINVVETSAVIYDFVANASYAQWKSGAGPLPFPGTSGDGRGYAFQVSNPHLEDDSFDSSPGLLTVPQNKYNGYIQATYPEFQVQSGDKLQTLVNCEFGATSCYVTFRIDYLTPTGAQKPLWSWKEAPDKRFYRASIDLSSLAGQKVRFVFMLLATGFASGDRAIWGSPRIVRNGTTQPPSLPSTLTPLPALTATATPLTPPPPTIAPSGCDRASFVTDVNVPDGTIFSPGAAFTKTWRLKNSGSCAWTTAYKLMYYSGEQMGAPTAVNIPWNVFSGQTVDISINMVAPSSAGKYRGFWILSNSNGGLFGIGTNAADPIWVEINVSGDSPINTGYDFVANACSAQWKSGAGILPCPSADGSSNGFVLKVDAPQLEDGSTGASSLITFPQNRYNGYIQGYYPTFTVQPGDRFQTTIGCAYKSSCYVTYRLDYMNPNGWIGTFWQWREQNEGRVYNANIDLSPLAGRSVRFILTILATGYATNDRAIWTAPRIVRAGGSTIPTVTPTTTTNDWLTYTNNKYGFQFKYPKAGVIAGGGNDNFTRIDLPFTQGTNLMDKYLEVIVAENANPCQSPLPTNHPPETVMINGISFLKQTGDEGAAGNRYQWTAYSTLRNNACISMDFVLHSLGAGAFEPPVPEFDKAAESAVFAQIMSTFGWLAPVPTPTYTSTPITVPGTIVPSPRIRSLHMFDASNGWAIGEAYLLRTVDGGTTWYNMTMPGVSSFTGSFFQSPTKVWVLTNFSEVNLGSLYRTTDGGATWTHYDVPFNNGSIQFLDDTHGFVLSSLGHATSKEAVAVYQTSDGGATWIRKYINDPTVPGAGDSLPLSGQKSGMAFRDTTTGWVSGDIPTNGFVYLYKTTDSGVTWSQQALALPAGYESAFISPNAPTFFGANDAIMPVWMSIGIADRNLFIYTTHDGGATWTPSAGFAHNVRGIDFISLMDAISWDEAGVISVTHNSGASWSQVTPNISVGDNAPNMDFVSTTTGWLFLNDVNGTGPTSLYRTMDGGSTWTLISGTAQLLPDLSIETMRIELQNTSCLASGDSLGVRVWIKNNGQAAAGSFTVTVNNIQQSVNGLGIGETIPLFFPNPTNPVTAIADSTNLIPESNEANNTRSEMVPIPTQPLPCATSTPTSTPTPFPLDFTAFGQTLVDGMNARNFDLMKAAMDQSFGIAFWQSQGTSYTPDLAIEQLRNSYLTLIPNASQDLYALTDGLNPYSIMGLSESNSKGLFVSGWRPDGTGEAILYFTRRPDGTVYWNSVLIAPTGFLPDIDPVSHDAFCADTRILSLIDQLRGSMSQSNGDMFAALATPGYGIDVRLWAYQPAVHFNGSNANTVFTSTQIYDWGAGHISGMPDTGTFKDIIQPKLLDVLNAPNMEKYCDDLTKVYPLATPWPYPNMHFYNLYKPSSSPQALDYRTWLVGFEYVNGQPYLAALVTIIAEP
jgi:photosystem II stability/assembly factor-like uncharacterized protein